MIRNIVTRDMTLNDNMKEKIMRKSDKFERWLGDDGRMEIKLETEANEVLAEITLQIHRHYYRSEGRDADYLTAFGQRWFARGYKYGDIEHSDTFDLDDDELFFKYLPELPAINR